MNRKLILLNVVLVAVVGYAGYRFRNEYRAAKARETAMHRAKVGSAPVAPLSALTEQPPVMATTYQVVATKTLFHPSRDPNLPVEVPPPPPPPPPMPALPKYRGAMNIGDGPVALLALGAETQEVKAGDRIGPFTLMDFNTVDMTFDWQGQVVRRTLDQLTDRQAQAVAVAEDAARTAAAPPPPAPVVKTALGPGEITSQGFKVCQANDSTPEGTVQGGFKKVSYQTPFGSACRWDPVGR
jgi:hypothetical protein